VDRRELPTTPSTYKKCDDGSHLGSSTSHPIPSHAIILLRRQRKLAPPPSHSPVRTGSVASLLSLLRLPGAMQPASIFPTEWMTMFLHCPQRANERLRIMYLLRTYVLALAHPQDTHPHTHTHIHPHTHQDTAHRQATYSESGSRAVQRGSGHWSLLVTSSSSSHTDSFHRRRRMPV
jgi:integrase